jgi:hypothetical protein
LGQKEDYKRVVKDVGTLPLVHHGGFTLILNNVLFVLSLQRNLISIALLEDEDNECVLGNNKCIIKLDNKVVGLAPMKGMLYMFSLNDFPVMNVCNSLAPMKGMLYMFSLNDFPVMNVCNVTNKLKRNTSDNETSSKL